MHTNWTYIQSSMTIIWKIHSRNDPECVLLQVGSSNYSALPLLSVAIVPQCVTWLLSFVYASLPLLATSWPSLARL